VSAPRVATTPPVPDHPVSSSDQPPPPRRRRLALGALLAAAALTVLALPWRSTWWGGWLVAVGEAGLVGGLADWFAVTALFRRPLGLPIPHTALIPSNWERLATRVGSMVGDRVLAREFLRAEAGRLDLAGPLQRGAAAVGRGDLEAATRAVARWAVQQLTPEVLDDLRQGVSAMLARRPISPHLADLLEAASREGWDRRAVDAAVDALGQALDQPAVLATLADVLDDLLHRYQSQLRRPSRIGLAVAERLGLLDRDRLLAALHDGLRGVARDPGHPLREHLVDALAGLPARLRQDPRLRSRVDAAAAEVLASPALARFGREATGALHRALLADLAGPRSGTVAFIVDRLEEARARLLEDAALRDELERWGRRHLVELVERHHGRIAALVEKGVRSLGPEGATRLVEEQAGEDLQFIRVNGTVVGALVGGALYALLHWLPGAR
jgi:uncharacterized membrane-anchored protein YjiN (DUF445 family)